jgi:phage shock protein C
MAVKKSAISKKTKPEEPHAESTSRPTRLYRSETNQNKSLFRSSQNENKSLFRSSQNRIIAGVCGGLGHYFDIDPTILRIVFVLMAIFGGSGILVYIILWLVIPSEVSNQVLSQDHIKENAKDMRQKAESFAHDIRGQGVQGKDSRPWWGILILVIGAAFLMSNFGLFDFSEVAKLWPLALVALGLFILFRR